MNEDDFKREYLGFFEPDKNAPVQHYCGECKFFIDGACSTSMLEAKHGSSCTPSCSDFITKETFKMTDEREYSDDEWVDSFDEDGGCESPTDQH